ncbi:plasmid replication protein RepC [Paracoccus sp. WLY502]|uniref:plasmid replication protein RepC n=1 Tax=Paracoccus yibinensis TaxID=3068891 RepID=UPI002796B1B9|nr:plasmid replication protein RepC [Paracoccus sp. WLY502]MDQ1902416.1 plasmid replication protein RepC [Paracoccus sp. WLY502]
MTYVKAITPMHASAIGSPLSARKDMDVWAAFRVVREAAASIGIKSEVIRTLETMVGFLRPGKGHTCFASNRELQRRLGGLSEKTIRRHAARLIDAGLVRRTDSPNRKRFSTRNPVDGSLEAFGFDLSPMILGIERWTSLLSAHREEEALKRHLRTLILARLAEADARRQVDVDTAEIRKALRRKHDSRDLQSILRDLDAHLLSEDCSNDPEAPALLAEDLAVAGGQNDRHQSMSQTEDLDKKPALADEDIRSQTESTQCNEARLLEKIETTCSEAMCFATQPLRDWGDVSKHAEMIAPMIGIDRSLLEVARVQFGERASAISILIMVQLHGRVRNMRAYYQSLVAGKRRSSFDPIALLDRMSRHTRCSIS